MDTNLTSLIARDTNDTFEIDSEHLEQVIAYNRQSKWQFPVGFPECINIKALAETIIANSGLYSSRKKEKWFTKLSKNPEMANDWYERLPLPKDPHNKLSVKQKLVLSALMMNNDRINHLKMQLSKRLLKGIPEIFLINRYHKSINGAPLFEDLESLGDAGDNVFWGDDHEQHPMALLAFIRCEALHSITSLFLIRVIITNIIEQAYKDILENNERAKDAAGAIFAVGSLSECRWFLDYVYQQSPEAFARHFSTLSFFNPGSLISQDRDSDDKPPLSAINMPYEPISLDLTSDQFRRIMLLHSQGLRLPMLESKISDLAENMSFDIDSPLAVYNYLDELLDETASCEAHLRTVRKEIQDLVIHRLPIYMNNHLERLEAVINRFYGVFTQHEKPSLDEAKASLNSFCQELPNAKSPKVAGLLAGVMQVDHLVDGAEYNVDAILKEHDQLSQEIRELSQDPVRNREQIQTSLTAMSEMDETVSEALENFEDCISALKNTLEMAQFRIMEVHAEGDKGSLESPDKGTDTDTEGSDYEELLDISESENRRLNKEVMELKAQKDSLTDALSSQRDISATEGMSTEVRHLVHKRFVAQDKLDVEECLLLTKALYPDTVILPSAWSSAAEYKHFENTEKLCDSLMTLAGDYLCEIRDGKPDSEARKLFPNKVFAANESETIASGALRKDREFIYNGQPHFFDKHLRLGVASDVRKTIRVHFDVLDGKMVIAFCGEHKRIQK